MARLQVSTHFEMGSGFGVEWGMGFNVESSRHEEFETLQNPSPIRDHLETIKRLLKLSHK